MALEIRDMKAYVPARDFEQSQRFYTALGFKGREGWGGTVDFELGGNRFRLQNFYVKEWAENSMFVIDVDDVEAWHEHVQAIAAGGEFEQMRIKPPETIGNALVLHVLDPAGVLLIFVQPQ